MQSMVFVSLEDFCVHLDSGEQLILQKGNTYASYLTGAQEPIIMMPNGSKWKLPTKMEKTDAGAEDPELEKDTRKEKRERKMQKLINIMQELRETRNNLFEKYWKGIISSEELHLLNAIDEAVFGIAEDISKLEKCKKGTRGC